MKILLAGLLGMGLIMGSFLVTEASAVPPNTPPGLVNNPGLTNNPGQALQQNPNLNGTRAVPIPGTLLLFGGGFAGLVGWGFMRNKNAKN